ncbi:decaprenyl-phosphate phosphoribosyltransferase [Synechococcus sp. M16.1]|uniref:decaprenyl-phosphate phosphoribosyltransferase n=1 Tax=Synechococcus sp. M16.1 TaxID=1442553 RepID=UPI001644E328|nr:decaprenyl-phosphate phosphoribosyltransferase [Synechococcus sp. M16.1]
MNPSAIARACRPRQWTKNLLVFAAPLFAFTVDAEIWLAASGSLVAFCLISSSTYLLNDSLDVEADRQHPRKRYRPIAAGQVPVPLALTTSALLVVLSLMLAAAVSVLLAGVILAYGLIQVGYCLRLKREPLLDLFCIAAGFLLRSMAGGVAAGLALSPWFLLTVGLLALFLAVEKRKAELQIALGRGVMTRQVLERYTLPLMLRMEGLLSTSAFMSYSLWSAGPALNGASTSWMLLTVPFVLVGIFRYQLLSDPEEAERRRASNPDRTSEKPEEILLGDRGIKLTLLGWLITTAVIGASIHAS